MTDRGAAYRSLREVPREGRLPWPVLESLAAEAGLDPFGSEFARHLDSRDHLAHLRLEFQIPKIGTLPGVDQSTVANPDEDCVYLCGHSLGLKPRGADQHMARQLKAWGQMGNLQHFHGDLPAALCDQPGREPTARLLGANKDDVSLMNGLTVNLNILLVTFYQPTAQRHKILIEDNSFSSDRYAVISHIRLHGFDPESSLIFVTPRENEDLIRTEDILEVIRKEGDSIAVIMISGVHYYTGQKFDLEAITVAGHEKGCIVGFDLAHSIGNVIVELNNWDVDFAAWCSYKYLNSGCGGMAGIYINERHHHSERPGLFGWWSNKPETRFQFLHEVDSDVGPEKYHISNPPPVLACLNLASLEIFEKTSMDELADKQFFLVGYLEALLKHSFPKDTSKIYVQQLTPEDPQHRGSQLSARFVNLPIGVRELSGRLIKRGILCDSRPPDVFRFGAVSLYVSFVDIFRCVETLKSVITA